MLTQEEDQQLVERVQRGDRRAFDLLVLKYQHKILRVDRAVRTRHPRGSRMWRRRLSSRPTGR